MEWFSRKPKTRSEIVAEADRARSRGRVKKAIAGYRKALETDPSDPSVNLKLAPLLAKIGDAEGGVRCFQVAAKKHLDAGFTDRAAAVNLTATTVFPLDESFCLEVARLNLLRGRKQDSVQVLLNGGRLQAKAKRLDVAVQLLTRGMEIEPWHLETGLALAPVMVRSGRGEGARKLIDGLLQRHPGPVRRIRWLAFKLWPGIGTFWRWLRA